MNVRMEVLKTMEERKQDVIEGDLGRVLLSVPNCIVYGRDKHRPDMEEDELCFDLQRSHDKLSRAQIDEFVAVAERAAESQGITIKYEYRWIGKGGFHDSISKIALVVQV